MGWYRVNVCGGFETPRGILGDGAVRELDEDEHWVRAALRRRHLVSTTRRGRPLAPAPPPDNLPPPLDGPEGRFAGAESVDDISQDFLRLFD